MQWSPLNLFLEIAFAIGLAIIIGLLVGAVRSRETRRIIRTSLVLDAWIVGYLGLVLAVSLTSRELILPRGHVKHFCGFYLDCHLSVAVRDVVATASIPGGGTVQRPAGTFYLITVQVGNDAARQALSLKQPAVWVIDDSGRRFAPLEAGSDFGGPAALSQPVPPSSSYPTVLAFDLPGDVRNPRLLVSQSNGAWPDRLLELFLIGNEDSLLHRKTTLALGAGSTLRFTAE